MSNLDIRQVLSHDPLDQIVNAAETTGDVILRAIDSELTVPLQLSASDGPDLVVSIGPIVVQNPTTGRNRSIPFINGALPNFTAGTITFPAASGGNITFAPSAPPVVLTCASTKYVKVLFFIDDVGSLSAVVGSKAATASAAVVPALPDSVFGIGYITVHNTSGTIDNITNSDITQFVNGDGKSTIPADSDTDRGLINYISNGGFSNGSLSAWNPTMGATGTWAAYQGAPESFPKNGVGGNPVVALSVNTTGALDGLNCLRMFAPTSIEDWGALGSGTADFYVLSILAISSSEVYIGGLFTSVGGVSNTYSIAKWDGSQWLACGSGMGVGSIVYTLAKKGNNLYVGGNFTSAGGISASRIAIYNTVSNTWSAIGAGVNDAVRAMAPDPGNDIVYVGGEFTASGATPLSFIAKVDTSTSIWSALETGCDNVVMALFLDGTDLYIGGYFTTGGGISANRIVKRTTGGTWANLAYGIAGHVNAITKIGTELFVGGSFAFANNAELSDTLASCVAKWDGISWSALGSGVNGVTRYKNLTNVGATGATGAAIVTITSNNHGFLPGDAVTVAVNTNSALSGNYTLLPATNTNQIVYGYTGALISPVADTGTIRAGGTDTALEVWALCDAGDGETLYVGGAFSHAGLVRANNFAQYGIGTNVWAAKGTINYSATYSLVNSIAVTPLGEVYLGGHLPLAGGVTINNIAKFGTNITQGNGFAYDFVLPPAYRTMSNLIQFTYRTDTNYATNNMMVYLYDKDLGILYPALQTITKADTPQGTTTLAFSPSATSSNYRLIFHVAMNTLGNWSLFLDDVMVTPNNRMIYPMGAASGTAALDCRVSDIFYKAGSASPSTITLNNMIEGQTVTVLVTSIASQAAITWAGGVFVWSGNVIPVPTVTVSRADRYVFQKINGTIYGSADMNCY